MAPWPIPLALLLLAQLPLDGTCSNVATKYAKVNKEGRLSELGDLAHALRGIRRTLAAEGNMSVTPQIAGLTRYARTGMFPYFALLYDAKPDQRTGARHYCGGSLVAPRLVVTAAHCTYNLDFSKRLPAVVRVNLVKAMKDKKSVARKAVRLIRHPKYNPAERGGYDIALIELDRPIKHVRFARLPIKAQFEDLKRGEDLMVMGFGATPNRPSSTRLKYTTVQYVPFQQCYNYFLYEQALLIRDVSMCAGSLGSNDACSGDDGGPLVIKDKPFVQVGIVSFGLSRCGKVAQIRGYVNLSEVRLWVLGVINLIPN